MKTHLFYIPEEINVIHHDKGVEEIWSPASYGVQFKKERVDDDQLLKDMVEWCREKGIWAYSDLVYFDTEEERSQFLFTWL